MSLVRLGPALVLAAVEFTLSSSVSEAIPPRHARHAHAPHCAAIQACARPTQRPPYGYDTSPTPTCRYADGTPYDPDIIGGPNHVGDGGPAANLGGFDPCGY